ncbi:MAG: hypothetical protein KAV25_00560 [Methanophagales archaeon]|nr:hypothetical protein [Methanophagales archaeon]
MQEISWTKHVIIMGKCKDDLEREFYIKEPVPQSNYHTTI